MAIDTVLDLLVLAGTVVGIAVMTVLAVGPLLLDMLPQPRRLAEVRPLTPAERRRPGSDRAAA